VSELVAILQHSPDQTSALSLKLTCSRENWFGK
jgi:hypothetical protein